MTLAMTPSPSARCHAVLQGHEPADLLLRGCRLIDVHSRAIERTDITIVAGHVASIDPCPDRRARRTVDAAGLYAAPGLIDAHMHVDTTSLSPSELARVIVPLGTTTVVVDNTNNAHTGGVMAVEAMLRGFEGLPLKGLMAAPSYCPFNTALETAAVDMGPDDIARLLDAGCVGIGETVWSKIALADPDYMTAIQATRARGRRVSGHGGELPRGDEAAFDAYVAAGIQDDHCIAVGPDLLPRLRRGLTLFCVEASGRRGQLRRLMDHAVRHGLPLDRMCLCVDNITLADMVAEGHGYLESLVRIAIAAGIAPVDAFRMASLHPAEHYRVADRIGSIAPGRAADILLLDAPDAFPPRMVIADGRVVAEHGRMVEPVRPSVFPAAYGRTIRLDRVSPDALGLAAPEGASRVRVQAIAVEDGDAFNTALTVDLPVRDGAVEPDPRGDLLKIAVVERYGRSGGVGLGFARGFGLKRGAMATSMSIPANNIVAVGVDDAALWTAIRRVEALQGGFVVVEDGRVLAEVAFPLGGIMASAPYEAVMADLRRAEEAARALGSSLRHPFFTMAQTVLSSLPDLGLTDKGLVDARRGTTVPVILGAVA